MQKILTSSDDSSVSAVLLSAGGGNANQAPAADKPAEGSAPAAGERNRAQQNRCWLGRQLPSYWAFATTKTNWLVFDIDMAKAAAKHMGVEVGFNPSTGPPKNQN